MKKVALLIALSILTFNGYSQKITFQDILNGIKEVAYSLGSHTEDVVYQSYIVNSVANARLLGGHDKLIMPINLPRNTLKWFYRITVVDKNSNFEWPEYERLYNCINNRTRPSDFSSVRIPINVYLINNAADYYNFSTGRPFNYLKDYSVLNTDSYFGQCNFNGDIWLCVQNVSPTVGSKVIVEVVATVHN